jgi:uncharacterized membrane protein YkvA (DUF1232 family)
MTHVVDDPRYLELFPQWLRSLGEDAAAVGALLGEGKDDEGSRWLVAGINYVFKSLDLIPDGVDDLGYLDDAFVLRVACSLAAATRTPHPEEESAGTGVVVTRLSDDARLVRDFLEGDYDRLERYVRGLQKSGARGRSVDDILSDPATRSAFLRDVREWSAAYQPPSFTRDPKTLVKLKAFLGAKLA